MVVANKNRNVLVAIRFDSQSRELIDWVLVNIAEPGDAVLAVHVCGCSGHSLKYKLLLDSFLEVFDGSCSSKNVNLNGQLSAGTSVRKTLVKEAKKHAAAALILGVSGKTFLRSWSSKAAYCAARLPPTTDVFAIQNGKVVYKRCSNYQLLELRCDLRRPSQGLLARDPQSEFGDSVADTEISSFDVLTRDGRDLAFEQRRKSTTIFSILNETPGWPLLRTPASAALSTQESRKLSVVQWTMSLPNRSPGSVYQDSSIGSPLQTRNGFLEQRNKLGDLFASDFVNGLEIQLRTNSSTCRWFKYEFLETISNFSSENLIGQGGSNNVYKGILPDGKVVAIKVCKSSQETKTDFAREVEIISSLNHRHITPLLGICITDENLISVYDYASKGSLEENLHGKNKEKSALSWEVRFSVAVKIAEALSYLHKECARPVVHRDIKSSNILLSDDFEPKLSDFGLAMWGSTTASYTIEEDVVGTFGYLAPEYFMYGRICDKVDMYAFGIVLLELLTGRKPIDSESPRGQESLLMWANPMIEKGNTRGILDPDLAEKFDESQMQRMVLAAALCTTRAARLRPNATEILKILRGDKEFTEKWINNQENQEDNANDDEVYPKSSTNLHMNVAMLNVDDDETATSFGSLEQSYNVSCEVYLKERWSISSSFD